MVRQSSRSVSYTHLDVYKRQIVGGVAGGLLLLFGREFLSILANEPEVIDAGMQRLRIMGFSFVVAPCCLLYTSIDAQVGLLDGLFNGLQSAGVPGGDQQRAGIGGAHGRDLLDGGGGAVVIHIAAVQHRGCLLYTSRPPG